MANGPLHGVTVLDLSRILAGPWASQLLADYGTDVIKVERPGNGDDTRHWGPPWVRDQNGAATAESAYYHSANRNKRSITINLGDVQGQQIVEDLCEKSDVLIENIKVGDLNIVPYQAFNAADGSFMLAVGTDAQFRACAACLGSPGLADDPRYIRNSLRVENRQTLTELIAQELAREPVEYWLRVFGENNVPARPINSIKTVLSEDYATERALIRHLPHSQAGEIPTVANPVKFSSSAIVYERAPPLLGEHTQSILTDDLSYSKKKIDRLKKCGAI